MNIPPTAGVGTGDVKAGTPMSDLEQRSAGLISETTYFARLDAKHGVPAPPTPEEELQQALHPPKDPREYQLPRPMGLSDERAEAMDVAWRSAFHAAGVPQIFAGQLMESVGASLQRFEHASPSERAAALMRAGNFLKLRWGSDFDKKMERASDLLTRMSAANPSLDELFDKAPWLFAVDSLAMHLLDRVAEGLTRR